MRRGLQIGLLGTLLGVVAWCYGALQADEHPDVARKTREIALVDMARVFNEYPRFAERRESLRLSITAAQGKLNERQTELQAMQERLKILDRSAPDYRDLEKRIAIESAEIERIQRDAKRRLFSEEAEMYEVIYRKVRAEVRHYAEQNGIKLVLRFSQVKVDESGETSPQDTMAKLQAQVVYHDGLDITDAILDALR